MWAKWTRKKQKNENYKIYIQKTYHKIQSISLFSIRRTILGWLLNPSVIYIPISNSTSLLSTKYTHTHLHMNIWKRLLLTLYANRSITIHRKAIQSKFHSENIKQKNNAVTVQVSIYVFVYHMCKCIGAEHIMSSHGIFRDSWLADRTASFYVQHKRKQCEFCWFFCCCRLFL